MNKIFKAINIFTAIAVTGTTVMIIVTLREVIGRLVFNRPLVGATEICEILMAVVLTAIGPSLLARKTTQVDVVMDKLPKKVSYPMDFVVLCINMIICVMLGIATLRSGIISFSQHRTYTFVGVSQWPFIFLLAFAFIVAGVATISFMITLYQKRNDEKTEADIFDDPELAILGSKEDLILKEEDAEQKEGDAEQ